MYRSFRRVSTKFLELKDEWIIYFCPFRIFLKCLEKSCYCAFDIFQKVVFCSALYTEEANLQTFVMINEKPFVVTTYT